MEITLSIWDGQLSIVSAPAGTKVILRDYDWGEYARNENPEAVEFDEDRDPYIETTVDA